VSRDITLRKRAEEALRESEEKFRVLADSANVGILLVQDEDIIYVNQALAAIGGYTVEECKHLKYWDVMPQENKEYIRWAGNARQYGWVGPSRSELKIIGKDGREIWLDCSWADPVLGGRPAVIVICVDITERKRMEEELKTAKMQAELYLDLMSHDINNMHQVAMGYLELARELPPGDDQAKFLDKSMEVLQRSTKLIGNVRKLQKFRDGQFQAVDIDICRTLLDIQSEYVVVPDKKINLKLDDHEKCLVRANELIDDVFANLVNNAVKHTREGTEIGVDLDVIEDNGKHFYRVTVEDNGPGIPDESKESIFNRMYMGSSRGMGLGLYIVRTLVNSYGGRVWAEDRIKGDHTKGARFVVLLPTIK
jgi:PAS domain S-box-containing protein